jgi:hypothetical protein
MVGHEEAAASAAEPEFLDDPVDEAEAQEET